MATPDRGPRVGHDRDVRGRRSFVRGPERRARGTSSRQRSRLPSTATLSRRSTSTGASSRRAGARKCSAAGSPIIRSVVADRAEDSRSADERPEREPRHGGDVEDEEARHRSTPGGGRRTACHAVVSAALARAPNEKARIIRPIRPTRMPTTRRRLSGAIIFRKKHKPTATARTIVRPDGCRDGIGAPPRAPLRPASDPPLAALRGSVRPTGPGDSASLR